MTDPVKDRSITPDARLIKIAEEIKGHSKEIRSRALAIGKLLAEAKEMFPPCHPKHAVDGGFTGWAKRECGISAETAWAYLRAYEKFKGVRHPELITPTAMKLLSEPCTPDDARKDAIKVANAGGNIDCNAAREIIRKHKPDFRPINRGELLGEVAVQAKKWIAAGMPDKHPLKRSVYGKIIVEIVEFALDNVISERTAVLRRAKLDAMREDAGVCV